VKWLLLLATGALISAMYLTCEVVAEPGSQPLMAVAAGALVAVAVTALHFASFLLTIDTHTRIMREVERQTREKRAQR
jgi:hypothetical protein